MTLGMSIVEQDELIKTLSNEQLQNYANNPDGTLPLYLVVAQLKRNEDTRSRFSALQAEQQTAQQPRTVVERLAPPRPGEIPVPSSQVAANPAPQIPLQQVGAPAPMPTVNAQEGLDFEKLVEAYAKVAAAEEEEKVDMRRPDHFGSGKGGSFEEGGETPTSRYPSNVMAALRKAIAEEERGGVKGGFRTRAPYQPERKKGRFTPAARHGRAPADKDFYTWNPLSTAMRYQDGLGGMSKSRRGRTVNAQDGYDPETIRSEIERQKVILAKQQGLVDLYTQAAAHKTPMAAETLVGETRARDDALSNLADLEAIYDVDPGRLRMHGRAEPLTSAEVATAAAPTKGLPPPQPRPMKAINPFPTTHVGDPDDPDFSHPARPMSDYERIGLVRTAEAEQVAAEKNPFLTYDPGLIGANPLNMVYPNKPSVMEIFSKMRGETSEDLMEEDLDKLSGTQISGYRSQWGTKLKEIKQKLPGKLASGTTRFFDRTGTWLGMTGGGRSKGEERAMDAAETEFALSQSNAVRNMPGSLILEQIGAPEWIVKEERNKEAKLAAVAPDETAKDGLTTGALAAEVVTPTGEVTVETKKTAPPPPPKEVLAALQMPTASPERKVVETTVRNNSESGQADKNVITARIGASELDKLATLEEQFAADQNVYNDFKQSIAEASRGNKTAIENLKKQYDALEEFRKTGKLPKGRRDKMLNTLLLSIGSRLLLNPSLSGAIGEFFADAPNVIKGEEDAYVTALKDQLEGAQAMEELKMKARNAKSTADRELVKFATLQKKGRSDLAGKRAELSLKEQDLARKYQSDIATAAYQEKMAQAAQTNATKPNPSTNAIQGKREVELSMMAEYIGKFNAAGRAGDRAEQDRLTKHYSEFWPLNPDGTGLDYNRPNVAKFDSFYKKHPYLRKATSPIADYAALAKVPADAAAVVASVRKEIDAVGLLGGGQVDAVLLGMMKKAGIKAEKDPNKTWKKLKKHHPELLTAFFVQKNQEYRGNPAIRANLLRQYGKYYVTGGGAPAATVARSLEQLRQNKK